MLIDEGLEILDEDECLRLLPTVPLGRVALSIGALPCIFPVNFAFIDGVIVFRTGSGTKLRAALDHAVVAFEVDAVDPIYHNGWSVQVVGVAEEFADGETDWTRRIPVAPWAPGPRTHFVRIHPEFVSGRRIARDDDRTLAP
jgi:uncharacterized protein